MSSPEILAPAGSFEALTAAVRCGADAVYLGGQTLNARRNAANFDDAALFEAVSLCHTHGTKLYLTLNTLASDGEMQDVRRMLEYASRIGVDALILQDLGVVRLVRESCDVMVNIPMSGRISSLNASAACSILLYEAVRQRLGQGGVSNG